MVLTMKGINAAASHDKNEDIEPLSSSVLKANIKAQEDKRLNMDSPEREQASNSCFVLGYN